MRPYRSISYAPQPIRPSAATMSNAAPRPEWTLCRKLEQVEIADGAVLQRWTEQGRVLPDDYLVSNDLDLCVQAREVAELDAVFRRKRAGVLCRASSMLVCAGLALVWLAPVIASALLASAIASAILGCRTASNHQEYRLYTTARQSDRELLATGRSEMFARTA